MRRLPPAAGSGGRGPGLAGTLALLALLLGGCGDGEPRIEGHMLTLAERGGSPPTVASEKEAVYVAWVGSEDDGESWDVHLARVLADGEVQRTVRVNDVPGDAAPHEQAPAQVRVAHDGTVFVVWQSTRWVTGRDFPASDLRLARSSDGGRSFEPAVTVNDDADGVPASHTFHDVAVAPDGTILVSWIDGRARAREEARRALEGGWSYGEPLDRPAEEAGGGAGHRHRASAEELPEQEIRLARSDDGGRTFAPSVLVDRAPCPCCRTSLAVAGDGTVFLSWRKLYQEDVRDVVVVRSRDGGRSFGAPVRVARDDWSIPGCPHSGASLALDGEGHLHVLWYTGREGSPGVYHAVSTDRGGSFGAARALLTDAWVPVARVAATPSGDAGVWAAWEDRREATRRVGFVRLDDGPPIRLRSLDGAFPALADRAGSLVAAWLDDEAVRLWIAP
jgi:hypothetical protein